MATNPQKKKLQGSLDYPDPAILMHRPRIIAAMDENEFAAFFFGLLDRYHESRREQNETRIEPVTRADIRRRLATIMVNPDGSTRNRTPCFKTVNDILDDLGVKPIIGDDRFDWNEINRKLDEKRRMGGRRR